MGEEGKPEVFLKTSLSFSLGEIGGGETLGGEATGQLDLEELQIMPKSGEIITIPYRSILAFKEGDYRFQLTLSSRENLELYYLGYQYEDFLKTLCRLRNEVLLKDMLMQESLKKGGLQGEFSLRNTAGKELANGICETRLYETALVILPERSEPVRLPFSDLLEWKEADYELTLQAEWQGTLILRQMGSHWDPFRKCLEEAAAALTARVHSLIKELVPGIDPATLRRAGQLLREGKAATKASLDALSPRLWPALESRLATLEERATGSEVDSEEGSEGSPPSAGEAEAATITQTFAHLKELARQDHMAIGIKRDLLGELTGEYLWFLLPIYGPDASQPGNAIAMESISTVGGGKATYFFRLLGRQEYRHRKSLEELDRLADNFIVEINRSMQAINFRREPIYLTDSQLGEPRFQKYLYSLQKLPELQRLRELYIGRVAHTSLERWKTTVAELLAFNVRELDDQSRFQKSA
jgi:hypothetical protein